MKSLVKNCPTHGLTTWMVIQTFNAGLNFTSQNLLDSAAGGTFMSTTLGAATKLLDEMMLNYSCRGKVTANVRRVGLIMRPLLRGGFEGRVDIETRLGN